MCVVCVFLILGFWSRDKNTDVVMYNSTKLSRFLVNVQLAFFALLQIAQIREFI